MNLRQKCIEKHKPLCYNTKDYIVGSEILTDNIYSLGKKTVGRFIYSDRFNTTYISFHFYLPLCNDTMTEDALLPYLLTSCCEEYKTFTELNTRLLQLYGAELSCSVSKSGDYLHTKIGLSVINNSFAYDNENVLHEGVKLLTSLIFSPSVSKGAFHTADLQREKRKTIERIESEINNKRSYARTRLIEMLFENEPYGRFLYGTSQEVEAISETSAYKAWERMLKKSYIHINVVGKELPNGLFDLVKSEIAKTDRTAISNVSASAPLLPKDKPLVKTEHMDITQGKLVMGFSSEVYGTLQKALPLMLFSDIFGGGPYSRLFSNVREKLSLCYYCSSQQRRSKGFLMVDSGVEADKAEEAEQAILKELQDIQSGIVEESRLSASKKSVIDSLASYYDSPNALDMWYTRDIGANDSLTPDDAIAMIEDITAEDIVKTARGIKLHSVYKLMPSKEVES